MPLENPITLLYRAVRNRWIALAATAVIGYVATRVLVYVLGDFYYDFYFYPSAKGPGYTYPELRYTFGQLAIFVWSVVGVGTAIALIRASLFGKGQQWAARLVVTFVCGFPILIVGFIVGGFLRDLGWH